MELKRHWLRIAGAFMCLLPGQAAPHGDLSWPANFKAASGARCCVGMTATGGPGDCTYLPDGVGDELTIKSKIEVDYPNGRAITTITNIYPTQDRMGRRVICRTGCLFTEEKV